MNGKKILRQAICFEINSIGSKMRLMKKTIQKTLLVMATSAGIALLGFSMVLAATIVVDGVFSDWDGVAGIVDPGGADDETAPGRADITVFRATADSGGIFLLMAWDDTAFTGGGASTAGVTLRTSGGENFRVYATAQGNPGTGLLEDLNITSCSDSTCSSQSAVCGGTGCTGSELQGGNSLVDPYSGRIDAACAGSSCGSMDTAVEMYIPWSLIGGVPAEGDTVFLRFGSYPSGPGQAPKDRGGENGFTCLNNAGTFDCYPSTPNAVTLSNFRAYSVLSKPGLFIMLLGVLGSLSAAAWASRKRK
jgi:hypothetical protein